jgi:hypothetical protein
MPYRTKGRYRHPMERVKVSMFIPISSCCGYGARLKDGHGVKRRSPQDTDQSRPMRRIPRNPPETRQNFRRKAHTPSDLSLPHPLRGRAVWRSAALAVRGVNLTPSLARKSTFCLRGTSGISPTSDHQVCLGCRLPSNYTSDKPYRYRTRHGATGTGYQGSRARITLGTLRLDLLGTFLRTEAVAV